MFGHQITSIDGRETSPEVDHSREFVDAVFFGVTGITDFNERDV